MPKLRVRRCIAMGEQPEIERDGRATKIPTNLDLRRTVVFWSFW